MVSQIQNTHLKNKQQQQEKKCIKLAVDSICFHETRFLNRHRHFGSKTGFLLFLYSWCFRKDPFSPLKKTMT